VRHLRQRRIDLGGDRRAQHLSPGHARQAGHRVVDIDDLAVCRQRQGLQRGREGTLALHEHHRRIDQADHRPQAGEIGGQQRIGRRHRHIRHAGQHGRHLEHRMLQAVAAEHHHRPAGPAERQQPLRRRIGLGRRLAVVQRLPGALRTAALQQPGALRLLKGVAAQHATQVRLHRAQRQAAVQQQRAVGPLHRGDGPGQERQRQEIGGGRGHHGGGLEGNRVVWLDRKATLYLSERLLHSRLP